MYKYIIIFVLPLLLSANLTYQSNYNKEVALLNSFDIEPSFLYDPIMSDMRAENSSFNQNKHFFETMSKAYIFIPSIKNTLSQYNIPKEFLYLAMAESNFKTRAYSSKRAAGLWQFMPRTGRSFKLKIDNYVDERRDLIKSTKAAAKYLTALHKRFGKWYLAAIAYNCGGNRLSKAIKKAGSDDLKILLESKKKYIPRESRYYIRKIVALALIGNDEKHMLSSEYEYLLNRADAYSISTVKVPPGESLKRVSQLINIPHAQLKELNRHLKYDFVPPYSKDYDIYIPYVKLSDFKQKYYKSPIENIYRLHIVKSGDNLSDIGKKYGVSYRVIKDFNKLRNNRLSLKQKLIIPVSKTGKFKKIKSQTTYYRVRSGDSLGSISEKYHVSIENLKYKNHIKGSMIRIGRRLKIYE